MKRYLLDSGIASDFINARGTVRAGVMDAARAGWRASGTALQVQKFTIHGPAFDRRSSGFECTTTGQVKNLFIDRHSTISKAYVG